MRITICYYLLLLAGLPFGAVAQNDDATVVFGADAFVGATLANYTPVNVVLVQNGYTGVRPNSPRYGVGVAICGPVTGKRPVRIGIQAMLQRNEIIVGNTRTASSGLSTQLSLELDVIHKGRILAGPVVGIGALTSTIDASKDNRVGSFNGYVSGNARAVSLNHLTFPLTLGGRVWLRLKNNTTRQLKRQGFALSAGYLLPLDGQNWYWANNVSLPNGPEQNTGSWYVQVGFGVR